MRRVVVPRAWIEAGEARLKGSLHHYLSRVLRLRPGAPLLLLDGSGGQLRGRIEENAGEETVVVIEEDTPPDEVLTEPRLTLVYGVSRRARTEWVLQKATELGVDTIVLAQCVRSVARPEGDRKRSRWEEIVRQAARQCGRPHLPLLVPPLPLAAAVSGAQGAPVRLLAHAGAPALSLVQPAIASRPSEIVLAVGPEGGFTEEEIAAAGAAGFLPVGLGPTVLRTETAALALLSLVGYLAGRLEPQLPPR
jgi:16S rRNA (uracil1498-N3)-methyltransferase